MNNSTQELDRQRTLLATERTRLAAERTLLSWIRTGLTGIGVGLAVARLLVFEQPWHQKIAHTVGQLLIVWGILIFIYALISYRRSCRQLELAISYRHVLIGITALVSLLSILSFLLLLMLIE